MRGSVKGIPFMAVEFLTKQGLDQIAEDNMDNFYYLNLKYFSTDKTNVKIRKEITRKNNLCSRFHW